MDGITLDHSCCAIHNCKAPLPWSRDRFCHIHQNENSICSITNCQQPIVQGKKTCKDPLHQKIEEVHDIRGKARFQLQQRLQRARVAHPPDGAVPQETNATLLVSDEEEDIFDIDQTGTILPQPKSADKEPTAGAQHLKTQFGRRTHNEQIIVAPCGVILGHATFFEAESIPSCVVHENQTAMVEL